MSELSVAVVGGFPGGKIALRWYLKEGFIPAVFELTSKVCGHWYDASDTPTGVFDRLLINIPYYETALTDILPIRCGPNEPYLSLFQRSYEFREYLIVLVCALRDTKLWRAICDFVFCLLADVLSAFILPITIDYLMHVAGMYSRR